MSVAAKRDLLIVTCAVSAGIHAALVAEHLEESTAAGGGFIAAAVVLGALAVALTRCPGSPSVALAAALTLAGLIVSYVLATTSGMPVLMPEPEPVEGPALATKAVELLGIAAAWSLIRSEDAVRFLQLRRQGASA
jgi:hypothetical protein